MRTKTRQLIAYLTDRLADRRGVALVELLMALTLVGLVAASFVPGLALGSTAAGRASQEAVAQALARRQSEYVKSFTYNKYPLLSLTTVLHHGRLDCFV